MLTSCKLTDSPEPSWANKWKRDTWIPPTTAIRAGFDYDGEPVFVGKTIYKGDHLPANVIPSKNICFFSYNGRQIENDTFEFLCTTNGEWVECSNGEVPCNAVEGGETADGETLYIGRIIRNSRGSVVVGKVHPSKKVCFVPLSGIEHQYSDYEVLALSIK
ncbi:unnamed protein product [Phyllotreta striolata]|uniref:Uncharacterized protein n=1 Tax=Phyllotreta striolata TaxID=444603 RepID=A0A9N9TTQ0_PHYSR|nr:unnamed protein product [Phyllotreta striolata]